MARAQTLSTGRQWWHQFPPALRELASVRLVASFGAGGVLYLTPMVFHQADFSPAQVGSGLALAALAGTIGRFASGWLLDLGLSCGVPVLLAGLCGFLGDALLLGAHEQQGYIAGQLLMGMAGGLYWPAVELAVPLCSPPIPSARGYALSRTADAAGIAGGTLAGALLAQLGLLRGLYWVDMAAIVALAALLLWRPLPKAVPARAAGVEPMPLGRWLPALLPMLLLSVVATAIPPLMQSALPLDLVRGGLERDAQPEAISALLIGIPLVLLLLIQWPVGQALARRSVAVGLRLSLLCFSGGTALMALSALSEGGLGLVVLALVLLAFGQAAFLPTATEAVVELSPKGHGGLAMALFSQCFALSAFGAPLIAGLLLDHQGHGLVLWLLVALVCTLSLLLIGPIQRRADAKG
ncbi:MULTISPECIES: MFS transporter [unclassified Synechococcus]|uniref:MFS transporter n=1 Tax=unclassified Synechococcus TaxID=2626047 RepID=UPI0020284E21|nr:MULTISPECIES: MFS transporter [unclassified Synechococcus]